MLLLQVFLAALAFAVSFVAAIAAPTSPTIPTLLERSHTVSINPPSDSVSFVHRIKQVERRYITNAERLARGLPLNPPVRKRSPEPHNPQPSSTPNGKKGIIEVTNTHNGQLVGFIGSSFNVFGEYTVTSSKSDALRVEIDNNAQFSGLTNIQTLNGPDVSFPFLGAIEGFVNDSPDLGVGSFNYIYLGGVPATAKNSGPSMVDNSFTSFTSIPEAAESVVWTIQFDGTLNAHWTNSDSSRPSLFGGFIEDTLIFTADKNAFTNAFGTTTFVSLKFLPA